MRWIFRRNRAAWNSAQRRDYTRGRLDLEALQPVVQGEMPLAVQANRASDLLAAMRLARRIQAELVLMGAAEGWRVAGELGSAEGPGRDQAADEHPVVRRARRDAGERGPAVEGRRDARPVLVRYAQRAQSPPGGGERNCLRSGSRARRCVRSRSRRRRSGASRRPVWLARARQGRRRRRLVGRSVRTDDRARAVFIKGREMSRDTRQRQLLERYRTIR